MPLILEDVCGKTMTDPHSIMQEEGRDFKFYNMLQHTFHKVNIVKVFTPLPICLFSQQFRGACPAA